MILFALLQSSLLIPFETRKDDHLYNLTVEELKEIDPWYREHAR